MTHIAIVSDTHAGASDPALEEALVRDVATCGATWLVCAGDLTQRARRGQFRHAEALLARLPPALILVPGNHDQPLYDVLRRLVAPLARFRRVAGQRLEEPLVAEGIALLGLATPRRSIIVNGAVDASQHGAIGRLGATPAGLRVLVAHHPLMAAAPDQPAARGGVAALDVAARAGIDVVVAGHHHRSRVDLVRVGGRSLLALHAGTATSVRRRGEPNAWLLVHVEDGGARLVIEERTARDGRFAAARTTTAVRGADGWRLDADGDPAARAGSAGRD